MAADLVKWGDAQDPSVMMEADANRYPRNTPDELNWTDAQRQKRAVAEYLAGREAEAQVWPGSRWPQMAILPTPTVVPITKARPIALGILLRNLLPLRGETGCYNL